MFYTALLLLPAVAYAQISILVEPQSKLEDRSHIYLFGEDVAMISDTERRTWQISKDQQLKNMVSRCMQKMPDDVYYKKPTPFQDMYNEPKWKEVHRILRPTHVEVSYRPELVTLAHQKFIYNSTKNYTKRYMPRLRHSVTDYVITAWDTEGELTVGQEISYSFLFPKLKYNFSYTEAWGKETNTFKRVDLIGSNSGVSVKLMPGDSLRADLIATRVSMELRVNYTAILAGHVAVNYRKHQSRPKSVNHVNITECLEKNHIYYNDKFPQMRTTLNSSVLINIRFHADATVVVSKDIEFKDRTDP